MKELQHIANISWALSLMEICNKSIERLLNKKVVGPMLANRTADSRHMGSLWYVIGRILSGGEKIQIDACSLIDRYLSRYRLWRPEEILIALETAAQFRYLNKEFVFDSIDTVEKKMNDSHVEADNCKCDSSYLNNTFLQRHDIGGGLALALTTLAVEESSKRGSSLKETKIFI